MSSWLSRVTTVPNRPKLDNPNLYILNGDCSEICSCKCSKRCFINCCCFLCMDVPPYLLEDLDIIEDLEKAFQQLQEQESGSLLKRYLSFEVYDNCKFLITASGITLLDIITSGVKNPDSFIGIYALDKDVYDVFYQLLWPILCAYHRTYELKKHPSVTDFGPELMFYSMDLDGAYIDNIRIEVARNFKNFKMLPAMSKKDLQDVLVICSGFCRHLRREFKGRFIRLKKLSEFEKENWGRRRLLYSDEDKFLEAAGGHQFWPFSRGLYVSDNQHYALWVNQEDHLKLISVEQSGSLEDCYNSFMKFYDKVHKRFKFLVHPEFGYLTLCPSNLGTGLKASLRIKLPLLQYYPEAIKAICTKHYITMYGNGGEYSLPDFSEFCISTRTTLGIEEFQCIIPLYHCAVELMYTDKTVSIPQKKQKIITERQYPGLVQKNKPTLRSPRPIKSPTSQASSGNATRSPITTSSKLNQSIRTKL